MLRWAAECSYIVTYTSTQLGYVLHTQIHDALLPRPVACTDRDDRVASPVPNTRQGRPGDFFHCNTAMAILSHGIQMTHFIPFIP